MSRWPDRTLQQRFEEKFERVPIAGCWLWTASVHKYGYGWFGITHDHIETAHRAAWQIYVGPIPEGAFVLHRCDIPCCVNPDHLFLGTADTNMKDMTQKGRHWRHLQTHCKRGHEFTVANTYVKSTGRGCRQCALADAKRQRERQNQSAPH